ncbi:MAG: hypothetical protein ACKVKS_07835, partial [Candidatus Poseidoniales archaeon]
MRAKTLVALLVTALMMTPVQAGDVTAMQDEPAEDPKQPDENNQTMYMYFNGSNGDVAWTHFQNMDNDSEETYMDENENGQVNVDISFRMTPELSKRIYIEEDGLIRGSFKINVQGDWTNDADSATACGQNDCEELNITLMAGPNIIGKHHETGLVQGDNTVVFNFQMEEDTVVDWNKKDFNPVVKVEMKLQGNYDDGGLLSFGSSGEPASFSMNMGTDSFLELPIDMASWDESFQDGGELGAEMEDTPGFTLVVASAAIAMAVFVNIG